MNMIVLKKYPTVEEARRVADWYARVDENCRPRNISRAQEWVTYDFVDGCYPSGWQAARMAHVTLMNHVWQPVATMGERVEYMRVNMEEYCDYVRGVADKISLDVKKILARLQREQVTLVQNCHGDATLSNMVQVHDRIVFIDPGHCRGLPCVELDEAKMLQSLYGYDELKYGCQFSGIDGVRVPLTWPFKGRPVHMLLLATHCVRLIPHQRANGREDLVQWALDMIDNVTKGISSTEWMRSLIHD